jgi:DNA polymerase-1
LELFAESTAPLEPPAGRGGRHVSAPDAARVSARCARRAQIVLATSARLREGLRQAGPAAESLLRDVELPLSTILGRMERAGIRIDTAALRGLAQELGTAVEAIRASVVRQAGWEVNLDSPVQLRRLLFEERGLPTQHRKKTGFSTDARALEELAALDPIVGEILEYRTLVKLKGTWVESLPALVHPETGRVHTTFRQDVAQTGRLSSVNPNLQNIPIRNQVGKRIRAAFVADRGKTFVAFDYSQIELRILAHLSGDPNLRSAFLEGVDVHRRTAAEVFEVPEDEVTEEQRAVAKAVNFGVIYGQTAFGLAQQLGIPRGRAGLYIKRYFERIPGVDRYMTELVEQARIRGWAETLLGRRRRIPELAASGAARAHGERMARNTPIQGTAADIMKVAMVQVARRLRDASFATMLLTVHDELVFECDLGHEEALIALVRPAMEQAIKLEVPLHVAVGRGHSWADCKG